MYTHSNHIPQPPHSAGLDYKGLRPRIDPAQVPSPIDAIEVDRQAWESKTHMTLPGTHAPLATSDFIAVDQGNSSPKFVRVSTWNMPSTSRLAAECHIPLAAIFQPFADLDVREESVPLVDFGPAGPPRCASCRAYINPWCTWVAGGLRWKCNLCAHESDVTPEYFSNLDPSFLRLDHLQRPELNKGTIDFAVSACPEYWAQDPAPRISQPYFSFPTDASSPPPTATPQVQANAERPKGREPRPMDWVFMLDVSSESTVSGFLAAACDSLRTVLYGRSPSSSNDGPALGEDDDDQEGCFPAECRVAIVTFDSTVHFYDLTDKLILVKSDMTPMLVVADVEEPFVPTRDDVLFVKPAEHRHTIESLLNAIPERFSQSNITDTAFGGALLSGLASLVRTPRWPHPSLPIDAPLTPFRSRLPSPAPPSPSTSEPTLPSPRAPFYHTTPQLLAEAGVGVSLFLAPGRWMDVGSVAGIAGGTGGEVFFHPRFGTARGEAGVLMEEVRGVVRRVGRGGYACDVRVRCSTGLTPTTPLGTFLPPPASAPEQITLGVLSPNSSIAFGLKHTSALSSLSASLLSPLSASFSPSSRSPSSLSPSSFSPSSFATALSSLSPSVGGGLSPRSYAHLQFAALYTTAQGERRVRVLNLALNVVELAGSVFQYADMEATVCWFAREALLGFYINGIHDHPTNLPHPGRPDREMLLHPPWLPHPLRIRHALNPTYRALPAFTLAIQKSKPLKARQVSSDVRNYHMHRVLGMAPRELVRYLYPRLLAVHDLDEEVALPVRGRVEGGEGEERMLMPSCMRDSYYFMEAGGIYLIDNEETMIFWIGSSASPQLLLDLFGTDDINALDPYMHTLHRLPTTLSHQVHNIIAHRLAQRTRSRRPKLYIARQNVDAAEIEFSDMLVEDQNNGALSYIDYLAVIHRQITNVLNNGGSLGGSSSMRSPW
ncbi:hypothetical protein B0H34DRAFT_850182 [Crassisporium funariophilum]|nr:hypothetical protein B0H34DRAFT_850182 [Crassisporium funariophilum]